MIQIKELTAPNDALLYNTMLQWGLIEDANSFRIAPADDSPGFFPTNGRPDNFTLGAYWDGTFCGMVSFARQNTNPSRLKFSHKGLLFRLYVHPGYRGKGVASSLIQQVTDRAKALGDIEQINLTVIGGNATATQLYEKFGFTTYGTEERAVKWNDRYFTEHMMVLFL